MAITTRCPYKGCGKWIYTGDHFCQDCGQRVYACSSGICDFISTEHFKRCPSCGTEQNIIQICRFCGKEGRGSNIKFCSGCGNKFGTKPATEALINTEEPNDFNPIPQ